jgi:hypothetical protein
MNCLVLGTPSRTRFLSLEETPCGTVFLNSERFEIVIVPNANSRDIRLDQGRNVDPDLAPLIKGGGELASRGDSP